MERLLAIALLAATLATIAAADATPRLGVEADFYAVVRGPVDNGTLTISCDSHTVRVVLVNDPRMFSVEVKPANPGDARLLPMIASCVVGRLSNESETVGAETATVRPPSETETTPTTTTAPATTLQSGEGSTFESPGALPTTPAGGGGQTATGEAGLAQKYGIAARLAIVLLAGLLGSATLRLLLR